MADPLSLSATAAGLLSLALQSTEYLFKFYSAYKSCSDDLKKTSDKVGDLLLNLRTLENLLETRKWRAGEQPILQNIETSISRCDTIITELQDEVRKFKKEPKDNIVKTLQVKGRFAAYPIRKSTLEKLNEDVNALHSILSTTLQTLQLKEHTNTQNDIQEIKEIIAITQAQHLAADLRGWLNAPDPTIEYNIACSKRHAKTGSWFVDGSDFTSWLECENSFLWLYGFAGCGKSVLCSTAIQYAFRHRASNANTAVAFFFFKFDDQSKQDASALLRALLLQLSEQIPGIERDLDHLKGRYTGIPPVSVLLEYLRHSLSRSANTYILLDALDECPEEDSRTTVLETIETMRAWSLSCLHLLVTSRNLLDIRDSLNVSDQNAVELKNDAVDEDIANYVSFKVDNDRQLRRWGKDRELIKQYLAEHAGGVFRWVECQLGPIKRCPQSSKHLQQCLRSLPQTLDKTYERMLCSIDDDLQEEAQRMLALLCFTFRPLSVGGMIEALAVNTNNLENYDEERKLSSANDLLRICPILIEITPPYEYWDDLCYESEDLVTQENDESEDDMNDDNDDDNNDESSENNPPDGTVEMNSRVVRLAHFSVQEYLESSRIRAGSATRFAMIKDNEHFNITKTCLIYLCHEPFINQILTRKLLWRFALARYAASRWYSHHHQLCKVGSETELLSWLQRLLLPKALTRWVRIWDHDQSWAKRVYYEDEPKYHASAMYYAALLGLKFVLSSLLMDSKADINRREEAGTYGTLLGAASMGGHERAVQLILDAGADVNLDIKRYSNALIGASMAGHEKIVRLLINAGAEVNASGGVDGSALQAASNGGYANVVQLLIMAGADVNAREGVNGSALRIASERGHGNVVKLLIKHGADVNAKGGGVYKKSLYAATEDNNKKTIQLFIPTETDIHAHGEVDRSALYVAAQCGHEDIAQLLISAGADVNAGAGKDKTALHAASERGHEKTVRLLLSAGADANKASLPAISTRGNEKIVQLLIDAGADINAHDGFYGTPLYAASQEGFETIVQLLLNSGADVDAHNGSFKTPVHAASARGHERVVQLLINAGADVNARSGLYGTAIHAASEEGHETVVQLLMNAGADIYAQGAGYGTAVDVASARGHKRIVQLLTYARIDV